MKKYYFTLVTFLFLAVANAQIVNIPDANFKAYLLSASPFNGIASSQTPDSSGNISVNHKIDTNNDGEIQVIEASIITALSFSSNFVSVEGLDSFVNLQILNIQDGNLLTSLDLSNLINLKKLNVTFSGITNINLDNLINLEIIRFFATSIINIDASDLINLKRFDCDFNYNLQTINVNGLANLEHLNCRNNQLTNLSLDGLISLEYLLCNNNQLVSLDVNELLNLTFLDCSYNYLTSLFIKNNNSNLLVEFITNPYITYICANQNYVADVQNRITEYGYTNCTVDSNCNLSVETNLYDDNYFTIYPNPVDEVLNLTSKQDTEVYSLTIYNLLGQEVQITTNPNNKVDVSSLKTGNYIVKVVTDKGVSSSKFVKE